MRAKTVPTILRVDHSDAATPFQARNPCAPTRVGGHGLSRWASRPEAGVNTSTAWMVQQRLVNALPVQYDTS